MNSDKIPKGWINPGDHLPWLLPCPSIGKELHDRIQLNLLTPDVSHDTRPTKVDRTKP
jgi:hypothetical protein